MATKHFCDNCGKETSLIDIKSTIVINPKHKWMKETIYLGTYSLCDNCIVTLHNTIKEKKTVLEKVKSICNVFKHKKVRKDK